MIPFNIPLVIVAVFLFLTLAVGLYFSRKETTLRQYAVGTKQFTTATLVATVLATNFSGGHLINMPELIYTKGLNIMVCYVIGVTMPYWFMKILVLRMGPFMGHLSMPDTIGKVYGKYPRLVVVLVSILTYITSISYYISIVSQPLASCIGLDSPKIFAIFYILVLIVYSAFGGVRAVLYTDVLQTTTFAMIIPLIACFLFLKTGKTLGEVVSLLSTKEKFQFTSILNTDNLLWYAFLVLSCMSDIYPVDIQRVYISSGPIQARKVYRYATFFSFIIGCCITSIGLLVFALAPELPPADMWGYILANIPPFFKGFVAISLLAMTMSTVDSFLHVCAVMVGHDMVEIIRGEKAMPYPHSIRIVMLTTLGIGLAIMVMVLVFDTKVLRMLMLCFMDFFSSAILASFILAVYGFRSSGRTALIGMATGVLTCYIWYKWVEARIGIDSFFIVIAANGLAMVAAHYLFPQPEGSGWVGTDDEFRQVQQAKERRKKRNKERDSALRMLLVVIMVIVLLTGILSALFRV